MTLAESAGRNQRKSVQRPEFPRIVNMPCRSAISHGTSCSPAPASRHRNHIIGTPLHAGLIGGHAPGVSRRSPNPAGTDPPRPGGQGVRGPGPRPGGADHVPGGADPRRLTPLRQSAVTERVRRAYARAARARSPQRVEHQCRRPCRSRWRLHGAESHAVRRSASGPVSRSAASAASRARAWSRIPLSRRAATRCRPSAGSQRSRGAAGARVRASFTAWRSASEVCGFSPTPRSTARATTSCRAGWY